MNDFTASNLNYIQALESGKTASTLKVDENEDIAYAYYDSNILNRPIRIVSRNSRNIIAEW